MNTCGHILMPHPGLVPEKKEKKRPLRWVHMCGHLMVIMICQNPVSQLLLLSGWKSHTRAISQNFCEKSKSMYLWLFNVSCNWIFMQRSSFSLIALDNLMQPMSQKWKKQISWQWFFWGGFLQKKITFFILQGGPLWLYVCRSGLGWTTHMCSCYVS